VDVDAARDALRRRSMFNVIDQASGWKVDFIVRKSRDVAGIVATVGEELDRAYVDRWIRQLGLEAEWAVALKTSAQRAPSDGAVIGGTKCAPRNPVMSPS
jgi:hypothetical protein